MTNTCGYDCGLLNDGDSGPVAIAGLYGAHAVIVICAVWLVVSNLNAWRRSRI